MTVPLHTRQTHPTYVPGCFACKLCSLQVAPSVASSTDSGAHVVAAKQWDAANERDLPAYKALREQGMQPAGITGCDRWVRSGASEYEITTGQHFEHEFDSSLATTMRREANAVVNDHRELLAPVPVKHERVEVPA